MSEMTEDKANEICRQTALNANHFIEAELTRQFEDMDDRISADVTVKVLLAETALKALKKITGIEYAKVVRCTDTASPK